MDSGSGDEPKDMEMEDEEALIQQELQDPDVVRLGPEMSDILEGAIGEEEEEDLTDEPGPSDDSAIVLEAHSKDAFCLDCSSNWIVTGGEDDTAAVFRANLDQKQPVLRITNHVDSVTCVRFNAAGTLLATGDMSGKIVITDLSKMSQRCEMDDCSDLEWIEWHFATDVLFAGGGDGIIWMYLIGPQGVAQTKTFASNVGAGCTVGKLLRDGKRLLAGYADGSVIIWSLKDGVSTTVASASSATCTTADEHSEQNWAVVGKDSGQFVMINTKSNTLMAEVMVEDSKDAEEGEELREEGKPLSVECVRFCKSREPWVAVGSSNGALGLYEIGSSVSARYVFSHERSPIVKCSWSQNGDSLVTACLDGFVRVWDPRNGTLIKSFSGAGEEIYDFMVCSDSVYTVSAGGRLRVFRL